MGRCVAKRGWHFGRKQDRVEHKRLYPSAHYSRWWPYKVDPNTALFEQGNILQDNKD
jgi:hypothetical protein